MEQTIKKFLLGLIIHIKKKLLNFNKDFINMNEIKNNDENIN